VRRYGGGAASGLPRRPSADRLHDREIVRSGAHHRHGRTSEKFAPLSIPGYPWCRARSGRGNVALAAAKPYVNKYEWLQVLLVYGHAALWMIATGIVYMSPVPVYPLVPLAIGKFEIQVGRRVAARMTFRATEPPMTARSALGGLRPWLLGPGVLTVVISVGLLAISVVVIVGAH
jgi:hypothetical protein